MSKHFEGRLHGSTHVADLNFTDPVEFQRVARVLGYRIGVGRTFKPGTSVTIELKNGTHVTGQVWSRAGETGSDVWVALGDRFVVLKPSSGDVRRDTSRHSEYLGRAA